jgi:hypothetical protein
VISFRVLRRIVICCLASFALSGAGCYERVVSTKGLGGVGTAVQQPYRSNTAADRAFDSMLGNEQKPPIGANTMPLTGKPKWTVDSTGNHGEVGNGN